MHRRWVRKILVKIFSWTEMRIAANALCALVLLLPDNGWAQQACYPAGTFQIAGAPFVCWGATTCITSGLSDLGRAAPGQGILLNPSLSNFPPGVIAFVFGHECMHFAGVVDEQAADCHAVKIGRNQGFINPQTLQQICQSIYFTTGDWTHFPGPARCRNMLNCYSTP